MKQLLLTSLLCIFIMLANAQQGDTLQIQRNKNGNVTYVRFKSSENRKLKDGVAFLKQILKESATIQRRHSQHAIKCIGFNTGNLFCTNYQWRHS